MKFVCNPNWAGDKIPLFHCLIPKIAINVMPRVMVNQNFRIWNVRKSKIKRQLVLPAQSMPCSEKIAGPMRLGLVTCARDVDGQQTSWWCRLRYRFRHACHAFGAQRIEKVVVQRLRRRCAVPTDVRRTNFRFQLVVCIVLMSAVEKIRCRCYRLALCAFRVMHLVVIGLVFHLSWKG